MQRLQRRETVPARIEAVAVATRGTDGHALALAMAAALECGTTATTDGMRKERTAIVAELQRDAPEGESRSTKNLGVNA